MGFVINIFSFLRPDDESLSEEKKSRIQIHRLLTIIGTAGLLGVGIIHRWVNPEATDPFWIRLGVAALFPGLLMLSYISRRIRHAYVACLRGLLYVGMTWLITIVSINEMIAGYALGLLLAYTTLVLVVGIWARTVRPVLWFAGYGFLLTLVGGLVAAAPLHIFAVLAGSMATAAIVEILVIWQLVSVREQLREREERLRSITENVSEGIYRARPDEGVVYANQTFAKMLGYDGPEALREASPNTFYVNPDERPLHREAVRHQEAFEGVEVEFQRTDGSTFTGLLSGTVVREHDGTVAYYDAAVTDITERKAYERKLEAAKEEAEEANRMKSAFLANMSHEIRTPLTSILGFAEMIGEKGREQEDSTLARFAGLIEKSGETLLETLNAVLNFSRLEAGEVNLSLEAVQLGTYIEEEVRLHQQRAEQEGVTLHTQEEVPVWAWADEGGLNVAVRNLISNALKYTEEGGTVWVRARTEGEEAIVEIEDNGIGMDSSAVLDLFEPFRQASEGVNREYQGTGLGLAVAQRMIQEMGGTIEVETAKGRGSCFTVRLPQADRSSV